MQAKNYSTVRVFISLGAQSYSSTQLLSTPFLRRACVVATHESPGVSVSP